VDNNGAAVQIGFIKKKKNKQSNNIVMIVIIIIWFSKILDKENSKCSVKNVSRLFYINLKPVIKNYGASTKRETDA